MFDLLANLLGSVLEAVTDIGGDAEGATDLAGTVGDASTTPMEFVDGATGDHQSAVQFGYSGRFDVPDAVSDRGNAVVSDASGNLFDQKTGDKLSRY